MGARAASMKGLQATVIYVQKPVWNRMKKVAKENKITASELTRRAMRQFLLHYGGYQFKPNKLGSWGGK